MLAFVELRGWYEIFVTAVWLVSEALEDVFIGTVELMVELLLMLAGLVEILDVEFVLLTDEFSVAFIDPYGETTKFVGWET